MSHPATQLPTLDSPMSCANPGFATHEAPSLPLNRRSSEDETDHDVLVGPKLGSRRRDQPRARLEDHSARADRHVQEVPLDCGPRPESGSLGHADRRCLAHARPDPRRPSAASPACEYHRPVCVPNALPSRSPRAPPDSFFFLIIRRTGRSTPPERPGPPPCRRGDPRRVLGRRLREDHHAADGL